MAWNFKKVIVVLILVLCCIFHNINFYQIFSVTDRVYVGMAGLATDVLTLDSLLKFNCNLYKLRENREIKAETFSALLSTLLYEKRFDLKKYLIINYTNIIIQPVRFPLNRFSPWFCEPIVAALTEEGKPFLSGMDLIGAPVFTEDFVVSGTCTSNLHGMCEALYKKDMVSSGYWVPGIAFLLYLTCVSSCVQEPEELFQVLSQCLLSAVDRDALSGWGAEVHIM